ncbi:MAG: sodium:calcium antiporter [Acidimicrobiia bacterium]
MIVFWLAVVVVGLTMAIVASGRAVGYASDLAFSFSVPPFVIGAIVVAIGTDLPEIANAVVSAITEHGDMATGTALGSTITQMTLVLGILPFVGGTMASGPRRIVLPGSMIVVGLLVGAVFGADGTLTRFEGAVLILVWVVSAVLIYRSAPPAGAPSMVASERRPARALTGVMVSLALVGAGATAAVMAFVEIAEALDVPLFLLSFFVASIGTSLPELVVDVVAIRRGEKDMAIGDIFGSSLIDATLALGIGPVIVPLAVDGSLLVRSALAGAVIVALLTFVLARRRHHDRVTGVLLLMAYAALYPVLLA